MDFNKMTVRLEMWFRSLYRNHYPYDLFVVMYAACMFLILLSLSVDGLFVTDEAVYFLTVKSLADNRTFEIWNGLGVLNDTSLRFSTLLVDSGGRLYGQYPPLYPFMALPFYLAFGVHGLVLMNLAAFFLSIVLLYCIVVNVFGDKLLAASSVVAFSLLTYSLEFGVGVWPHMLSVFLVLFSFYLLLNGGSFLRLFALGFVSGSAVGVRYQDIVFSAVFALYLLLKVDLKKLACFLAGLSIPIALVLSLNYSHFGRLGTGYPELDVFFGGYGYFHLALLAALAVAAYTVHARLSPVFRRRRITLACLTTAVLFLALFQLFDPTWLEKLRVSLEVVYAEVFDIGSFPVVHVSEGKKALLQSAPFLILSLFALGAAGRAKPGRDMLVLFMAFSFAEVVFFSAVVRQHGEDTGNMRFFLESLPFLAALSVYAVLGLIKDVLSPGARAYSLLFLSSVMLFLYANRDGFVFEFYRKFPLVLASLLVVSYVLRDKSRHFKALCACFIVVACAYSFLLSAGELTVSVVTREAQKQVTSEVCRNLETESMIAYSRNTDIINLAPARLCQNPLFARVDLSKNEDASGFIELYLGKNKTVYLVEDENDIGWSAFASDLASRHESRTIIESNVTLIELHY